VDLRPAFRNRIIVSFSVRARAYLETAAIGAAGALILTVLQVPAGGLVGAMTAVAIASLAGRPTGFPAPLQALLFMVVGASTGAAATPEALKSIASWPASLAILLASTLAMYAVGYWVFRTLGKCDPVTAFFAAAPGALSAVIIMAESEGAVMSRVAAAQALRVAVITACSPFLLTAFHLHPTFQTAVGGREGLLDWALLIASGPIGWFIADRLKWPSPPFLGPMALSGLLHALGWLTISPPRALVLIASAGLGALVGTRFRGVDPRRLLGFFPPAVVSFTAMAAIGLSAGWAAGLVAHVGPMAGMLGFAPGSMDVLIAIALASGQAPAYVAAHHTARLLGVLATVPWVGPKIRAKA
jgi:membrane AbrB-like protein